MNYMLKTVLLSFTALLLISCSNGNQLPLLPTITSVLSATARI